MEAQPEHINPFASPLAEDAFQTPEFSPELDEVRTIRRDHLSREASIQSVGLLYLAGAALMTLVIGIVMFGALQDLASGRGAGQPDMLGTLLFVALSAASWWIGLGLRRLNPAVRVWAIVSSAVGLLAFPFGSIISGYVIWLLASKKGKHVFTPEYKQVIAQTQDIKYRTSIITWIALAVLVLLLVYVVVSVAIASPRPIVNAPSP